MSVSETAEAPAVTPLSAVPVKRKAPPKAPHALDIETGRAASPAQEARLIQLREAYPGLEGSDLIAAMNREFKGKLAVVSSFGSESAVLLHMLAQADPTVPVIFLNTGKLFGETLRYRDRLQDLLGLTDLRVIAPHPADVKRLDPEGTLWSRDPDKCCALRKVWPLQRALEPFEAQMTGRKRFQTAARSAIQTIELADGRFRINPLANFGREELAAYIAAYNLPQHPLVADGYLSIGCMPCTERVKQGEDYRSGRWAGIDKEECGIHEPTLEDGEGI
jgi:phosphoadenosine phosphosulfate reductase